MRLELLVILLLGISLVYSESDFEERDDALEFLNAKRELDLVKRFLYSGKEQRREVRENYEEKCERKIVSKALKKPRWCPELDTWPAWNEVSKNDGYKKKSG